MGKELTQAEMRLFQFCIFFAIAYFVFASLCAPVVISNYNSMNLAQSPSGQIILWDKGDFTSAYEYNSSGWQIEFHPAIRPSSTLRLEFLSDGRIISWAYLTYNFITKTYEFPDTCYWTTKNGYVYSTNVGHNAEFGYYSPIDWTVAKINVSDFNAAYDSIYGAAIFQLYASNNDVYATVAAVPYNFSDCFTAYASGALKIFVFPGAVYSAGNQTSPLTTVPSSLDIASGLFNANFGGAISYPFNLLLCLPFWFCSCLCAWIFFMKVLPDWM
jgi:hypothetical protein